MIKISKRIEIVRTSTPRLSSMSQESCDALYAVLTKHYAKVGVSVVNDLSDLEVLVSLRPDVVFLGVKFVPVSQGSDAERIWAAKYLDDYGIAYTGSDYLAHNLERNKPLAKQRVFDAGLMTSPFWIARQNRPLTEAGQLPAFPLFVKPTDRGGGLGIDANSVVRNSQELVSKVGSIGKLRSDSLIEQYLPGREFSVAVLKDESPADYLVMPIELIAPPGSRGDRILSGSVKSSNAELAVEVADKFMKSKVEKLALKVFAALGARDYGRIDIRLDKNGVPNFLEANLMPSLISGYGSFPKACEINKGLGHEQMVLSIVQLAMARTEALVEEIPEPGEAEVLPAFGLA